jgi:VanZ family protein
MTDARTRPWLLALLAWAGIMFLLSSIPNPPGPRATDLRSTLAHIAEYAVFGFLALNLLARWRGQLTARLVAAAWLLSVAWGISDELHQALVPRRDASVLDVLADAAGAALGVAAAAFSLRARRDRLSRTADLPGPAPRRSAQ